MKIPQRIFKFAFQKIGYDIKKITEPQSFKERVTLKPNGVSKGNVLLAYIVEPFLRQDADSFTSHTHFWESYQIAKTYLAMGYSVDVIDYRNDSFIPKKKYTLFISARTNFETIAKRLNRDCVKVVHLDTAHWMFNNNSVYNRYLSLQRRRGFTVRLRKIFRQNWAIENADCATILGNQFTIDTYTYSKKPIFPLSIPTCRTYPRPNGKDFKNCRFNFLWMGSSGLVNKGLDLTLEVFTKVPNFHLYVCGPIKDERDFETAYSHELYQLNNITTIGWVDISSDQFLDIVKNCIALIYPSCSEGQAGVVATCMQAGLIPIVSNESGIDVGDLGIILKECSHDEIKQAIKAISETSPEVLKEMCMSSWNYARQHHSQESYKKAYSEVARKILSRFVDPYFQ